MHPTFKIIALLVVVLAACSCRAREIHETDEGGLDGKRECFCRCRARRCVSVEDAAVRRAGESTAERIYSLARPRSLSYVESNSYDFGPKPWYKISLCSDKIKNEAECKAADCIWFPCPGGDCWTYKKIP